MLAVPATSSPKATSFTSDPTIRKQFHNSSGSSAVMCIPFVTCPDIEKPMGIGTSFLCVTCSTV